MNKLINAFGKGALDFARDEEGAQVVEYALIIALVSIALALALAAMAPGAFTGLVTRITNCLAGNCDPPAPE